MLRWLQGILFPQKKRGIELQNSQINMHVIVYPLKPASQANMVVQTFLDDVDPFGEVFMAR